MPPVNSWKSILGEIAIEIVSDLFNTKSKNDKTPMKEQYEDYEDLGYAVVIDDDGNEIKNY